MPELPEVETVLRSVAPHVVGRRIREVSLTSARVTRADHGKTAQALAGRTIQSARRHGKQIFFELDRGILYIHLGMTGKLLWNATPGKYARAVFVLDEGMLVYDDVRQFGRVEYHDRPPKNLDAVGPDALQVDFAKFFERLKERRMRIKPLLMNQRFISGVGNIYADEALYASKIHPRTFAGRISEARARTLHGQLAAILQTAIAHRGSSISDYVDGCGERGSYQNQHAVYGRTGEPCLECGTPVRRIVLGGRGTHYCPRCQRV